MKSPIDVDIIIDNLLEYHSYLKRYFIYLISELFINWNHQSCLNEFNLMESSELRIKMNLLWKLKYFKRY